MTCTSSTSLSSDETVEIARAAGAEVAQHAFERYGQQRNWAIENLPLKHGWELHLDADERLDAGARGGDQSRHGGAARRH